MITFVRTFSIAPGKNAEVMSFTRQARKLFADKFGVELRATVPIGGDPNRIAYSANFESLAEYERTLLKIVADSDYQKLIAAYMPHIDHGTTQDQLWRDV